jgi:glutathione S-transferase
MIKLYHAPRSRSTRMLWLLEEFGLPYTVEYVSITRMDGSDGPDARNPHPDKKVPAIVNNDVLVTETSAICIYLNDLATHSPVAVPSNDVRRGPFLTWIAYYSAVIEPLIAMNMAGFADDPVVKRTWRTSAEVAQRLLTTLNDGPYLLGDQFSAADVLIASIGHWSRKMLPPDAVIDDYLARVNARPALQRGLAKDSG